MSTFLEKSEEAPDIILYKDGLEFGIFVEEGIAHHLDGSVTIEKRESRQLLN
jgi:hypothetical protein